MTIETNHGITMRTLEQRTAEAHTLVDRFRADLRLAAEIRPYSNEFAEGLADRMFVANAATWPVGVLVYTIRLLVTAERQRQADPQQDCVNVWGLPQVLSCREVDLVELEREAAAALVDTLLHGPWPI